LAVRFDKTGLVTEIQRYEMADGKTLILVERTTPTRGRELTVIEQLFGNIGRFSSQQQQ
jgi:outer membrane protein assembly factor BamE (lipoprotein component of BamABCDE complex)